MPRIQHKRGTSANLASVNPTPLAGELVWDSTENAIKIGDGATAWSSLAYVTATPRTHKSTHATGGSDALTPGDIGAAPAASPTFTGVITVAATSGSAGSYAPSLTFSGDPNTGFGQVSGQSDTASVFTAGVERLRVDSSGRLLANGANATDFNPYADDLVLHSGGSQTGITLRGTQYNTIAFADGTGSTNNLRGWVQYLHDDDSLRLGAGGGARLYITSGGNVGIGATSPSALLDINSDKIRLRTAKTPASASDTGNAGDICWDASYLYICTATNTWRRIAHSTW